MEKNRDFMNSMLKKFRLDPFVFSLYGAILLAYLAPAVGSQGGIFSLTRLAHFGFSIIFFFYGLKLDGQKIRSDLANYRVHLVVQLATFVLFPILILAVVVPFRLIPTDGAFTTMTGALWLGVFFLAALPSTVSSSVVMVNIAGGNVPSAIFNASVSSLAGVFITPLWMRLYVQAGNGGNGLAETLLSLIGQVIVPIVLGLLLNRRFGGIAKKKDRALRIFDQSVIVLIVYTSFCHSFAERMFDGLSFRMLTVLIFGMILLFFVVYGLINIVCRILKFRRRDRITTLFCGSKKSLVHGTIMSSVILADPKLAGILILPTMIYHALQLMIVGMIAQRFAKLREKENLSSGGM